MKRSSFLAALTAAAVLAAPAAASAAPASPTAGGSTGSTASGAKVFSFRGMNLKLPTSWRVYRSGDWNLVTTRSCPEPYYPAQRCEGFWVLGPEAIADGLPSGKNPFLPGFAQPNCPYNYVKDFWFFEGKPKRGLRQIGPGHKAKYAAWPAYCAPSHEKWRSIEFTQREWFLPTSKILVVDYWDIPGLATVLKNATWS
ncbi:hypothetical protein GCM10010517_64340 [Streptosporangium fragile]|uniref:Secreted protein n=1 Tax=Streptosporangium fragile TaxID=46186 RepID=A0ABP6IMV0_9ACTN